MKNRIGSYHRAKCEQLITTFGNAKLVRAADGATELRGGLADDRTAAKEWVSLFMHEAVLRIRVGRR